MSRFAIMARDMAVQIMARRKTMAPQLKAGDYSRGIADGVEETISALTHPLWYFKWFILGGVALIVSLILAFYAKANNKTGATWFLFTIAGAILITLIVIAWRGILSGDGDGSDSGGIGGGDSSGGGASGDF